MAIFTIINTSGVWPLDVCPKAAAKASTAANGFLRPALLIMSAIARKTTASRGKPKRCRSGSSLAGTSTACGITTTGTGDTAAIAR